MGTLGQILEVLNMERLRMPGDRLLGFSGDGDADREMMKSQVPVSRPLVYAHLRSAPTNTRLPYPSARSDLTARSQGNTMIQLRVSRGSI